MALELKCENSTQDIAFTYRHKKMENVKEKKRNMEFRRAWSNIQLTGYLEE